MNIIGNLGDPNKVAESLKPLIAEAEDKALAELHASVSVALASLEQELQKTREMISTVIVQFGNNLTGTVNQNVDKVCETVKTIADGYQVTITKKKVGQ